MKNNPLQIKYFNCYGNIMKIKKQKSFLEFMDKEKLEMEKHNFLIKNFNKLSKEKFN